MLTLGVLCDNISRVPTSLTSRFAGFSRTFKELELFSSNLQAWILVFLYKFQEFPKDLRSHVFLLPINSHDAALAEAVAAVF